MNILIKKIGSSLLGSRDNIEKFSEQLFDNIKATKEKSVIVLSAFKGETDELYDSIPNSIKLSQEKSDINITDSIITTGEMYSAAAVSSRLKKLGLNVKVFNAFQLRIMVKVTKLGLDIYDIENSKKITDFLTQENGDAVVVCGFQALDREDNIVSLGRGGSDLTAIAIAKFLNLSSCSMYKDSGAIMDIDPKSRIQSNYIDSMSYKDAITLTSWGSCIVQKEAIEYARDNDIGITISNLNADSLCTKILSQERTDINFSHSISEINCLICAKENQQDIDIISNIIGKYKHNKEYYCNKIESVCGKFILIYKFHDSISSDAKEVISQIEDKYSEAIDMFSNISLIMVNAPQINDIKNDHGIFNYRIGSNQYILGCSDHKKDMLVSLYEKYIKK